MGFLFKLGQAKESLITDLTIVGLNSTEMHTYDTKRHVQEYYVSFQNWKPLTYPLAK